MAQAIKELDRITLTVPLEGADVFDDTRVFQLPVGSEGTVMLAFGNEAYEVEFIVRPNPTDPEDWYSVEIVVKADQCLPSFIGKERNPALKGLNAPA